MVAFTIVSTIELRLSTADNKTPFEDALYASTRVIQWTSIYN